MCARLRLSSRAGQSWCRSGRAGGRCSAFWAELSAHPSDPCASGTSSSQTCTPSLSTGVAGAHAPMPRLTSMVRVLVDVYYQFCFYLSGAAVTDPARTSITRLPHAQASGSPRPPRTRTTRAPSRRTTRCRLCCERGALRASDRPHRPRTRRALPLWWRFQQCLKVPLLAALAFI
jgi:hypothetical protein